MTLEQQRNYFLLMGKQLRQAFELAEQAAGGDFNEHATPHRTASHILGICSYVNEQVHHVLRAIEDGV